MKTKVQKFEVKTIARNEIKQAPYNPRKISGDNLKRLKKNIKKRGLLEPIVINKTTGNLVSGHRRLEIIDSIEKTDQYSLDAAFVELSEQEEKEQNVFFNNPDAQGEFDFPKLENIIIDVDIDNLGFDDASLALFGVEEIDNSEPGEAPGELIDSVEKINKMKSIRKQHKLNDRAKNNCDYYTVLIFRDEKHWKEFCNKYFKGELVDYVKADDFLKVVSNNVP